MDQESLAQIQQLIAAATDALRGSSRTPNGMQVFWRKGFVTNSSLLPKDFRCISTGVMPRIDSFLKSNSEKHARLSNTHMADSHDVSRLFLGRISLNQ